ncbi:MAG TPA: hypothetical protein VLB75_01895 [Steroidobacteraceae bacterium]|nr:hypothetical protein [Steroidobacteraceae bacterium]
MHADIDQLLMLRDGEDATAGAGTHVRDCVHCQAELARLKALSADLRELPSAAVPPERWSAIKTELARGSQKPERALHRQPGWLLPVASAALVLVAVLFTFANRERHDGLGSIDTALTAIALDESRQQLVAESQRLESLLAALPREPRLTRAQTALTVADLEDRIQWVDYRLGLASEAGLDAEPAERLWRERVDLLNSLVAVRYAEARTVAF